MPPRRLNAHAFAVTVAVLAGLLLAACGEPEKPAPVVTTRVAEQHQPIYTYATRTAVSLSWPAYPGAVSYTLYWSESPDVASNRDNSIEGIKGTKYVHRGLKTGRIHYYALSALDKDGEVLHNYLPIGDIPYTYPVKRYGDFLAVTPRVNDTFDSLAGRHLKDWRKGWIIKEFNGLSTLTPFKGILVPLKPLDPGGLSTKGYRMVPVLVYHHLSRTRANKMTVRVTEFNRQMAYLKRHRYEVITLKQLVDFLRHRDTVPEKAVVITFDDGWTSTLTLGLPILRRYNFPATLFLYTDLVGATRKSLTWAQVRALDKSGIIDVQCHSKSHGNLTMRPEENIKGYLDRLKEELITSRNLIKAKTGKLCRYLAYPYGASNHLVAAMAEKAGYRAAFSVRRGANPFFVHNFRIWRSMVYGGHDLDQFGAQLTNFGSQVLK